MAATTKSHHNVGGLPEDMEMELVEPLRLLFKDEVRRVGEELGLDPEFVWRQPFPGPGLAIRIIGEVTEERLAILRRADAILLEEVRRADLYRDPLQMEPGDSDSSTISRTPTHQPSDRRRAVASGAGSRDRPVGRSFLRSRPRGSGARSSW